MIKIGFFDPIPWDYNVETPELQPLGGSQSALCYLATALASQKQQVFLFNYITKPGIYRGVTCLSLNNIIATDLLTTLDVAIVLNSPDIGLQLKSLLGQQTKLILWMQHAHDQPAALSLQNSQIKNCYNAIAFVSEWQRQIFIKQFNLSGLTAVLRNAIAPVFENLFTNENNWLTAKAKTLTLAYTSTPFRGLDLLLAIFPKIRQIFPEARLKVFSSMKVYQVAETQDEWSQLYQLCRTTPGVDYIGSVSQKELAQAMRSIHILAYPNTFPETSCIAVMEALASGCFVVTSDLGALPETTAGFASLIAPNLSPTRAEGERSQLPFLSRDSDYAEKFISSIYNIGTLLGFSPSVTRQTNAEELAAAKRNNLLKQRQDVVNYFNNSCTWSVRSVEWLQWLETLIMTETMMTELVNVESIYDRALSLQRQGNWEQAIVEYQKIIEIQPNYAPAYFQLANYQLVQEKWPKAIELYRQALSHEIRYSQAWYNLGVAYQNLNDTNNAINAYQQAINYNPQYLLPYNNLAVLLEKLNRIEEAFTCYEQALKIKPDYVPAIGNLANLQHRCAKLTEAEANYRRVLQLEPNNLNGMAALVKICQEVCNWQELETLSTQMWEIANEMMAQGTFTEFSVFDFVMYSPFSASQFHDVTRYFSKYISAKVQKYWGETALVKHSLQPPKKRPKKLKLGYLAGDYFNHALTHLMVQLFETHDRDRFEIFAYSLGPDDQSWQRQKIASDCDKFVDLNNLRADVAAAKIAEDGIHILMDMAGYTQYANPEILALKPAHIQVNYLTYAGTMGADFIDYIVTDPIITPPHFAEFFTEKFIYLPDTYQINSNQRFCPAENPQFKQTNPKSSYGLPENAFVFMCFNHSRKIESIMFGIWLKILAQVPNSVLWLLESNPEANQNLQAQAEKQGIKADRIIFAPRCLTEEHIIRHQWGDLFLDTLYYNAHTTASDALWMGVPLITCPGKTFASRVAASLLNAVDLPQLVTENLAEYERLAVHLATHPDELQKLKDHLHTNRRQFRLFDTVRMVRHLEVAYQMVWDNYQSKNDPTHIYVPSLSGAEIMKPKKMKKSPIEIPQIKPGTPIVAVNNAAVAAPSVVASQEVSPTTTQHDIIADREFIPWLTQQGMSIACTTYQTSRLILIGVNQEQQNLSGYWRIFDRAMGLYCTPERLLLSTKYQIWQMDNVLSPGQLYQSYDKMYIPRISYTTGDLDIHDITLDQNGQILFISTMLNCLATVSDKHSCKPLWKPPFISQFINEDRCHLNGLAMVNGKPKYVTAVSQSDVVDGWRDRRKNGGVIIDIDTNEIIIKGLSMPHSPRWYQGKLWVLNSGRGELGYIDGQTGKFEAIAFCPGYLRGLAFWQDFAIVGLSKSRRDDHTFGGLELDQLLVAKDADPRCGLMVINLQTGAVVHWLRFEGVVTELYDVQIIPQTHKPMAIGFQTDEIAQIITLDQ